MSQTQKDIIARYKKDINDIKRGKSIPSHIQDQIKEEEKLQYNTRNQEQIIKEDETQKQPEEEDYNDFLYLLNAEKETEEKLLQKKREFELQAQMEMNKINELLIKQYDFAQQQKELEANKLKEDRKDDLVMKQYLNAKDDKDLQRTPKFPGNTPDEYIKRRVDIYQKLTEVEIRNLLLEMKKSYAKYNSSEYIENLDKWKELVTEHYLESKEFYAQQPLVEYTRHNCLKMLGQIHYLDQCMRNLQNKNTTQEEDEYFKYDAQFDQKINQLDPESEEYKTLKIQSEKVRRAQESRRLELQEKKKQEFQKKIGQKMKENEEKRLQQLKQQELQDDFNDNDNNKRPKFSRTYLTANNEIRNVEDDFLEKDIDRPKIWNYNKDPQLEKYNEVVEKYMQMKDALERDKNNAIFRDQIENINEDNNVNNVDILDQVDKYLKTRQQQKGVQLDNYKDLLPQSINFNYFKDENLEDILEDSD
ncbi:hypothetical protein PPERSA_11104 [Pseudocohnilembus persalinus]|uniref:Uncharacterized protein n=1 Tax=Pseudocohnilembus persalinus TaxID=266149 RepID=A0A0V0QZ22_PSEPJ|nr:hypothetical protein PPERSA_11104 [Pseudocohnilembus persalinus]|eukprot:KRX07555.1 hypothetical protein PPERSA_11104 [Pseudocohnilembus persalinus]